MQYHREYGGFLMTEVLGTKRQFVKTMYIDKKNTTDGFDKVIIVSKDENEKRYVQVIEKPKLTYYITKPEYWDESISNYIPFDKVNKVACYFKNKDKSIVKELGDVNLKTNYESLMSRNNYQDYRQASKLVNLDYRVHGSDINIEDQYIDIFLHKYPAEENYIGLSKAFFDIEVDGSEVDGFPDQEKAQAPVNAITYVDMKAQVCYSYCLKYDTDTYKEFMADKENVYKDLKERYRAKGTNYENFEFKIFEYDSEVQLLGEFMFYINEVFRPDFCMAWNLDFDFITVHNRLLNLGQEPAQYFSPSDFKYKYVYYKRDTISNDPSEKSSIFLTSSYTTWVDQLALYANINKGRGKLESYSLDFVGDYEVGERKDEYEGNIKTLHFTDYRTFLLYNIQDTMLASLIEEKCNHVDLIYQIATVTSTRTSHAMKKTVSLRNLGGKFYAQRGVVLSNNRSSLFPKQKGKIPGAFVGDPNLIAPVGVSMIFGMSDKIFDNVIDIDLTALYPSITMAFNISPETHAGKIDSIDENGEVNTPAFIDAYNSMDVINFCIDYEGLPTISEMVDFIHLETKKAVEA